MNGSLLLAVERTENLVRRGSHPRLSVILIVEGSPSYTMRALESIQNQDLYDLQIVVVCRGVVAGVRHSLEVAADRDIHIDLIDVKTRCLAPACVPALRLRAAPDHCDECQ